MSDQQQRSLKILSASHAILGGLIAIVVLILMGIRPDDLKFFGLTIGSAIIGVFSVVYYLTIHQLLRRRDHLSLSALILSAISAINLALTIIATGGLDSPYYSLWLLAIITAGIFGLRETLSLLGITTAYYAYTLFTKDFSGHYIRDHIIQLIITLIATALAEWIHNRNRRAKANQGKLESLSGQLSAEQLKAEAIMASIGEGVMVIDGARRIQLFNHAAATLTGWEESSAQNIDYRTVLSLHTSDDQELTDLNDPFIEAWKKGETIVRDNLTTTSRSGRKIQLSLSVSPIYDTNQNPNGAVALFRDISKEKEVERQKEEFVSTASHEMRTPVAAIEGYISLAMNPNVATIDDRAKKYLDKAHDTIRHLGDLFRDLLSVTKAEEGQLGGKIEPVEIGKLLQGAVDDMQFTAQKKSLTLVYQIGGQGGKTIAPIYYVAANPERLREVVMNLMDNAIKFTSEGGIRVTLDGTDHDVTVNVSDTGIGIAKEDIGHLFQKFYRIDNSATRTIGGTGLGLYLCRRVIELFNGRIWVDSKQGQGSTFHFSLPRLTQDQVTRMQAAALANGAGGNQAEPTAGAIIQPDSTPSDAPASLGSTPTPVASDASSSQPASGPNPADEPPVAAPAPIAMPIPAYDDEIETAESGPAITPTPLYMQPTNPADHIVRDHHPRHIR